MFLTFPSKTLFVFLLIALTSLVFGIIPSFAQGDKSTYECDGLFKGGKKPTVEQLEQIFQEHTKWIESEEKEGTRAKLCGANLTKAHLSMAHLTKADLTKANLTKADLFKANLTKADLTKANLTKAYLIKADLTKADLTKANLTKAYLFKANLTKADLTKANLSKAELRGANLSKANLAGATLTNVKNLIQSQLNQACVDEDTTLPEGLTRPAPCGEEE
jgi:uncharacterized protein YjbI with pentapeptide repeats